MLVLIPCVLSMRTVQLVKWLQSLWLEKEISSAQSWVEVDKSNFFFLILDEAPCFWNLVVQYLRFSLASSKCGGAGSAAKSRICILWLWNFVVPCSQRVSFHECDKPDHSSFGQNTHGHNDRLPFSLPPPSQFTSAEFIYS